MAFWSGETIRQRLGTLVDPPDPGCIDGAAYKLKVGPEYYVSATDLDPDHNTKTLKTLDAGQAFCIPGGQFALILTEEIVKLPANVMGLFSIKSSVKWQGMINVSGFHIDPGFWGRLTIAVYNAGSSPIHLRRGDPVFLIWIADLDAQTDDIYKKYAKPETEPRTQIDVDRVLNKAPSETVSLQSLDAKVNQNKQKIDKKIESLRLRYGLIVWGVALIVGLFGSWAYDKFFKPEAPREPTSASSPASIGRPTSTPSTPHT